MSSVWLECDLAFRQGKILFVITQRFSLFIKCSFISVLLVGIHYYSYDETHLKAEVIALGCSSGLQKTLVG